MSESILFSIVIPTYNRAGHIGKTLQSVLNQLYTNFEIIVVDDGSTDDTEIIVRALNDKRVNYFKKQNAERAAARNFGVRHADGDFITFLDSDDKFKSNCLTEALNFMQHTPQAEIFHTGYDVVKPNGEIIQHWKKLPNPVNDKLIEGNFLSCLGIFAKREVFLANPFNEDRALSGTEDYELWIRLAARYTIFTSPVSTACLVDHATRSVLSIQPDQFLRRIALAKQYMCDDTQVSTVYGRRLRIIFAYLDLYAALHLAISNNKPIGRHKLYEAWSGHPPLMLSYRFWVVIKKLILS